MSVWRNSSDARVLRAPSSFIEPCLPTVRETLPVAPGWFYEIKHDGYRLQIHIRDGRVRLYTRRGADWTERFPLIVDAAQRLSVSSAIFDAEVIIADDDGRADFDALHSRTREHEAI